MEMDTMVSKQGSLPCVFVGIEFEHTS